jgi:protein O-mannosyl-transferase
MTTDRTAKIGLTIATILAYLNCFGTAFQFDDRASILEDARLGSLTAFWGHLPEMIRPLLKLTFLFDRFLYGEYPGGYHLINVLLHCGSALLVFAIVSRACRDLDDANRPQTGVPFLATLLFALHPIQTESVTYISGRATGMAAFFCLLSLNLFLLSDGRRELSLKRSRSRQERLFYAGALLSFTLALGSKEIAMVLPGLLLVWHLVWGTRSLRLHAPFWGILGLAALGAMLHPRYVFLAYASFETRPFYDNLLTQANAVCYALSLFFVPWWLNFDHDLRVFHSVAQWPVPVCLALLLGLGTAGVCTRRRLPVFCFGILWFLLCLLPANGFIPRYDILSERNLYLPSIGLFTAVAGLAVPAGSRLLRAKPLGIYSRAVAGCGSLLLAGLLLAGTAARNQVYSDEVTFWSDAARKSPQKARTHNNLGYALFRTGEVDRALEEFRTALRLDPEHVSARQNLQRAWKIKHRLPDHGNGSE